MFVWICLSVVMATILAVVHSKTHTLEAERFSYMVCWPIYLVFWPIFLFMSVTSETGRKGWVDVLGLPKPMYQIWHFVDGRPATKIADTPTLAEAMEGLKNLLLTTGGTFAIKHPNGQWHQWEDLQHTDVRE